jgi:hypothetical protein
MKQIILFSVMLVMTFQSVAQEQDEHLLDGTSMNYYYQNGSGVHVEFLDGQLRFNWIAPGLIQVLKGWKNIDQERLETKCT